MHELDEVEYTELGEHPLVQTLNNIQQRTYDAAYLERHNVITMVGDDSTLVPEDRNTWFFRNWFRWCPTSPSSLAEAEQNILSNVWDRLEKTFVRIANGTKYIRTVSLNREKQTTPIVLVHGMGAGVGLWALNIDKLAQDRPVYAFDVLGFGRSSRPDFSKDPMLAEAEFIESMEEWRKEMKLNKFVLLGHSLGGFLSAGYAVSYPQHVSHLVLVDPWGFPERPLEGTEQQQRLPRWIRVLARAASPFNPLAGLRVAGPLGPIMVHRFRPDLMRKFSELGDEEVVAQYIYHCNAQYPSGEAAFKTLSIPFGWAKNPMINRMHELPSELPLTLIYGSRSWVDNSAGYEIKYIRSDSYVDVQVLKGAGHHVYADRATEFNEVVCRICKMVDNQGDRSQGDPCTTKTPV